MTNALRTLAAAYAAEDGLMITAIRMIFRVRAAIFGLFSVWLNVTILSHEPLTGSCGSWKLNGRMVSLNRIWSGYFMNRQPAQMYKVDRVTWLVAEVQVALGA